MTKLEEFQKTLEEYNTLWDKKNPEAARIQNEFEFIVKAEWKSMFPRRPFFMNKAAKELANFEVLKKPFQDRADVIRENERQARLALERKLDALAEEVKITESDFIPDKKMWSRYSDSSSSSYGSQGFGAVKYAREEAEGKLAHLTHYGIPAEIRKVDHEPYVSCGWTMDGATFTVYAAIPESLCEVVRRKSGPSLREIVAGYWRKGANPRVFMPLLPAGYEKSVGLDYFGNDIKKEEKTA